MCLSPKWVFFFFVIVYSFLFFLCEMGVWTCSNPLASGSWVCWGYGLFFMLLCQVLLRIRSERNAELGCMSGVWEADSKREEDLWLGEQAGLHSDTVSKWTNKQTNKYKAVKLAWKNFLKSKGRENNNYFRRLYLSFGRQRLVPSAVCREVEL